MLRKVMCVGLAGVSMLLVSGLASAQKNYGMAGCGLGSMLIDGRGVSSQVSAATTNGTMGNQTFGITSGTSKCTQDGAVAKEKQVQAFAEATLPNILRDAARGRGEYVAALGHLYGCKHKDLPAFGKAMQKNFRTICKNKQCMKAESFISATDRQMSAQPTLAKSCGRLAPLVVASR